MKLSVPYLANRLKQLPFPGQYGNDAVEAILFNREDLESATWKEVWEGIQQASRLYSPKNVTFHFPVNNCDYVSDPYVRDRLIEAYRRACEIGLQGIVVHSNRIRPISEWHKIDLLDERNCLLDTLLEIVKEKNSTWLALENMPLMDNFGIEIDPLFVYPEDFLILENTPIKVVWDTCHYSSTQANVQRVEAGKSSPNYYPSLKKTSQLAFLEILDLITHWHFSAFCGIADPDSKEICKEGVVPEASTLGNEYYKHSFAQIAAHSAIDAHMVFEIQEDDYLERRETKRMIEWANSLLPKSYS